MDLIWRYHAVTPSIPKRQDKDWHDGAIRDAEGASDSPVLSRVAQEVEEAIIEMIAEAKSPCPPAHDVLGRTHVQKREAVLLSRKAVTLEGSDVRSIASRAHVHSHRKAQKRVRTAKQNQTPHGGISQGVRFRRIMRELGLDR